MRLVEREWKGLADRFQYGVLRGVLAERLRRDRPALESLLDLQVDALVRRSGAVAGLARQFRDLESQSRLSRSLDEIVSTFLHAFVNRLGRSAATEHETVLYD